ncbi:acyl--CoA ligase [Metallumcola ferriviriculae]|uniref:Acyl--CoA ligase n=1 Tax=Metallumcola ferriviriculae TaxID=3039180 RepID=A0AAU0UNV3_9FIRM|nr:acyl--CoA ligase [Desulfitibacteraceae bacterium MK1]
MILSTQEHITEYTDKGWWGKKTLIEYFKEHVELQPEHTALVDPPDRQELTGTAPERLTYAQLDRAVDAVATSLAGMGIGKDDIVMVQLPNTWELAMLYLAICRTGAIISPAPMQWRFRELQYIGDLTRAKALITVTEFKNFAHGTMAYKLQANSNKMEHVITLEDIRKMTRGNGDSRLLDSIPIDANDIFTICWTSGTEAESKGCPLSHNNWLYQCNVGIGTADIRPGDVQMTAGPLVNMASLGTTYIPWIILGGTFVLHHPFNLPVFIRQMMEEKVNYTLLVPAVANIMVKHPQSDQFRFESIRSITLGSAPPSLFTIREFKKRWGIDIGNIWGQNEGTAIVSGARDVPEVEKRVDHLPQFGKAGAQWASDTSGIHTKLVDPDTGSEVTDIGGVGELAYKGPNVIPGYFRRPDLDAKSFDEQGYFYTGDLFQIKEGNYVSFFDRKKDIIIRGGYNISAQEVENILLSHSKVAEVAAVGMPDEKLGERTCIYVVPRPGETFDLQELVDFMTEQGCAVYKLPERLEIVEEIPRNPVGKILKSILRSDLEKKIKMSS